VGCEYAGCEDVNAVDRNGWTALHLAAFHGRLGCVQLLLRWGGRADDVDNSGNTAGLSNIGQLTALVTGVDHRVDRPGDTSPLSLKLGEVMCFVLSLYVLGRQMLIVF